MKECQRGMEAALRAPAALSVSPVTSHRQPTGVPHNLPAPHHCIPQSTPVHTTCLFVPLHARRLDRGWSRCSSSGHARQFYPIPDRRRDYDRSARKKTGKADALPPGKLSTPEAFGACRSAVPRTAPARRFKEPHPPSRAAKTKPGSGSRINLLRSHFDASFLPHRPLSRLTFPQGCKNERRQQLHRQSNVLSHIWQQRA